MQSTTGYMTNAFVSPPKTLSLPLAKRGKRKSELQKLSSEPNPKLPQRD